MGQGQALQRLTFHEHVYREPFPWMRAFDETLTNFHTAQG